MAPDTEPGMIFLNGKLVPDEEARVSAADRGFLYGDGLFETLRVYSGQPFRWDEHFERLQFGADYLRLRIPFPSAALLAFATELIAANNLPDSLLRLNISRGPGARGYSPAGALHPTVVMSLHPAPILDPDRPAQWRLVRSTVQVRSGDPLTQFKTTNQLRQVLARIDADEAGADEALLFNETGAAVEGSASNLFWIEGKSVRTPPVSTGALPGVTRAAILDLCARHGIPAAETAPAQDSLRKADGIFMTLTSLEVAEVVALDGAPVPVSPLSGMLREAFARTRPKPR